MRQTRTKLITLVTAMTFFVTLSVRMHATTLRHPAHVSVRQTIAEPLTDDKIVTASLIEGQTRLYKIHVAAGEFVLIKALQKEVNVALALLDSNDHVLADMDMEIDLSRKEFLGWIGQKDSDYFLRVVPGRFNETFGVFQLEIARHQAKDQDQHWLRAQSIVMDAQSLAKQEDTDRRNARKYVTDSTNRFEESLPVWALAGDKNAQARTMIIIGESSRRLGDHRRARGMFERAVTLRKEAKDRWGEAEALNDLAIVLDETGEKQKALELHELALSIRREIGYLKGQIIELQNTAKTLFDLDEFELLQKKQEEIRSLLDEYKRITGGAGDPLGEAEYANKYGLFYDRLGQQQQAITWYEKALDVIRAIPDHANNPEYIVAESTYMSNLAKSYSGKGDKKRARELYEKALQLCGNGCAREKQANMYHNLGNVSLALDDNQTAEKSLNEALKLRGNDPYYESYTRIALGNFYFKTKDFTKARTEFDRALKLSEVVGARHMKVAALEGIARVELASNNEAAELPIEEGLAEVENLASRVVNPDQRASYLADTQRLYDHKITLLMRKQKREPTKGFSAEAFAVLERARARGLVELLTEAQVNVRAGVNPSLRQRERAVLQRLADKTDYLIALKSRKERASAARLQTDVAKLSKEIAIQEQDINIINLERDQIQDAMRRSDVRYTELVRPKPIDVQQVQREILDSKTMLLEYRLIDKESYVFAVTAEDFNVYPLPDRETVNKAVSDLYESLTARSKKFDFEPADERERRLHREDDKFNARAPELSQMILGQVTRLSDKKRVLIVADGLLQYFPFAALPLPNGGSAPEARYLVNKYEIVYLPSASALRLIQAGQSRPRPKKKLAVIADPIYQPSSAAATTNERAGDAAVLGLSLADAPEPLKYARQEAESILSMVRANDRAEFLGERATKQAAAADDLVQYRFIHYGVHGTFDSEYPTRSGLIFSMFDRKGTPIKGGKILTLAEVYNLKLSADLVTLSSCQTALGQEVRGEGIIGLTRGFMYAGTRRVLASLWIVNDEATALLMRRFYSHLLPKGKSLPPAEALKAAQESMTDYHPFYWAGFTLQGEW